MKDSKDSTKISLDNSPLVRQVIQTLSDLAPQPLANLRILDLGCAHGMYAIELGKLGATVLGIEGRDAWLDHARRVKQEAGLPNVEFVKDDVRHLSKAKYGEFDVVLCLGILYHLDTPAVFEFVNEVADVCRHLTMVETHFATKPILSHPWRGKHYWGRSIYEHAAGTAPADKLKKLGASLDNERSFWLTRASLCNILRHVGFTSVQACQNPVSNLYVGANREFKIWGNRVTLAAIKGKPISLFSHPETSAQSEEDWPEDIGAHLFERYLSGRTIAGRLQYLASVHLPVQVQRRLVAAKNRLQKGSHHPL